MGLRAACADGDPCVPRPPARSTRCGAVRRRHTLRWRHGPRPALSRYHAARCYPVAQCYPAARCCPVPPCCQGTSDARAGVSTLPTAAPSTWHVPDPARVTRYRVLASGAGRTDQLLAGAARVRCPPPRRPAGRRRPPRPGLRDRWARSPGAPRSSPGPGGVRAGLVLSPPRRPRAASRPLLVARPPTLVTCG